jgi:hypothetical protein
MTIALMAAILEHGRLNNHQGILLLLQVLR